MSTHRLEEIGEPFCRILVFNEGEIVRDLQLAELAGLLQQSMIVFGSDTSPETIERALSHIRESGHFRPRAVRAEYQGAPSILVGPAPPGSCPEGVEARLDIEGLLQLWLRPDVFSKV